MPPDPSELVFVDGSVVARAEAHVAADLPGFLLGVAVFETILVVGGRPTFLSAHLERLRDGARTVGIPWPSPGEPAHAIAALVQALELETGAVRLTLSRGRQGDTAPAAPCLVVTARRVEPIPAAGVVASLSPLRVLAGDPLAALKSTSRLRYVLAREEARLGGAFEALLLTSDGDLAEGTVSNVFLVGEGTLVTPPLDRGVLPGIVRAQVLREVRRDPVLDGDRGTLEVHEGRIEPAELVGARELFLTNATGGVIPVRELRGVAAEPIALPGAAGPVAREIRGRIRGLGERDRAGPGG